MNEKLFKQWCDKQHCGDKPDCDACKRLYGIAFSHGVQDVNLNVLTKRFIIKFFMIIPVVFISIIITVCMIGCPSYNVYVNKMNGKAILAHAQSSREVAVAEAKAKMESAQLLAGADTLRAHGVARSNEIIGNSLKDNEAYLRYLWIDELGRTSNQIIYVPTEANLPILEANRKK